MQQISISIWRSPPAPALAGCLCLSAYAQPTKTSRRDSPAKPQPTAARQPIELRVGMTPDQWTYKEGAVEFIEHKGTKALKLNAQSGVVILKDINFKDGTIEFDVEINQFMPAPTLYFRRKDANETECVYLRSRYGAKKNAPDHVQYASIVKGVNMWDLQHEFQTSADIRVNEWNHLKLVVSGKQLRVYVNNMQQPALEIPCLEGDSMEGSIALETGQPGTAIFANLVIKPGLVDDLPAAATPDITQHEVRYIRHWQVSKPEPLPNGKELNAAMLPTEAMTWEPMQTERRAILNLTRKFGRSDQRRYVWVKAKIKSEMAQKQLLKMGFSDEMWVFINQKPIHTDKNLYRLGMRKDPDGRLSIDNCAFVLPLQKGDNELLIGLANDFYGWGIMAQLENVDGIELIK